ncbi:MULTISPECIES: hypothetical protein [unclassified Bradyrhizobium]|uniref:hypothetical protein n=1 Tax=unclassified Bradyrhizobium TaxID=2631580 RepID=UPI00211DF1ED|nr:MULTISPECIES: hypothetical protein [unclassified Bradyrhizobium]MDD1533037.1 hypothetical protein [Bradyrhizobium sp. WBOS8]MDD1582691.1 hypothetical protein [Bradyrhizobium sp. WBOS4]UUO48439.1 hypothetical protein DCM78_16895 [Bradyrhizobium sp. WBOS04]UUO62061.1 hypothetical protein DCM80_24640 [Bradyrhizobium sp. WBOS08]
MAEARVTFTDEAEFAESITLRLRTNYAIVHLMAAARFSRRVGVIQSEHLNDGFGDWWDEMLHNAVACLLLTAACLESYANELFADRETVFAGIAPHVIDKVWDLSERGSPLDKLDTAVELLQKPGFDKKADLYKAVLAVVRLRNALTHFKPEWSDEVDKHKKLSDALKGLFQYDDRHFQNEGIFPRAWAGHGCTAWAVNTVIAFLKQFESQAGLSTRTNWDAFAVRLES